jgi:hypothetical protein
MRWIFSIDAGMPALASVGVGKAGGVVGATVGLGSDTVVGATVGLGSDTVVGIAVGGAAGAQDAASRTTKKKLQMTVHLLKVRKRFNWLLSQS